MINKSNIGEVSIEEKGFRLTIKQKEEPVQQIITAPVSAQPVAAIAAAPLAAALAPAAAAAAEKPARPAEPPAGNTITIKSPMIGTFYRSPSPDKPSFVNIGDDVEPGSVRLRHVGSVGKAGHGRYRRRTPARPKHLPAGRPWL